MCIVFLYFCDEPDPNGYRLVIASNRDEVYCRPAAGAKFWDTNPNIIAGMDLKPGREGGTWLGFNRNGKFAAITNYRQAPKFVNPRAKGKGHLVSDFLQGDDDANEYLHNVRSNGDQYHGFNLLVGKLSVIGQSTVGYYCNVVEKEIKLLRPGIHALSNHVLNCSWGKMVHGRHKLAEILAKCCTKEQIISELISLLRRRQRSFSCEEDRSCFSLQDDPNDEKHMNLVDACRSIFMDYKEMNCGTRTNTVVLVDAQGHVTYVEYAMASGATDPDKAEWEESIHEFDIQDTST
ncbi:transport and Golgi organization protein 2 homolog [Montipora foliosa]|uniref:transport and Golgi organization protein 2 homolog n=1 Tax=Montipora foliosa TaxID=591990 RepID=UPI0035F14769